MASAPAHSGQGKLAKINQTDDSREHRERKRRREGEEFMRAAASRPLSPLLSWLDLYLARTDNSIDSRRVQSPPGSSWPVSPRRIQKRRPLAWLWFEFPPGELAERSQWSAQATSEETTARARFTQSHGAGPTRLPRHSVATLGCFKYHYLLKIIADNIPVNCSLRTGANGDAFPPVRFLSVVDLACSPSSSSGARAQTSFFLPRSIGGGGGGLSPSAGRARN